MTAREVHTDLGAYRAAVAELAPRVRPGRGPEAIRVVDGRGSWWERLVDAAAFVVDEPDPAPATVHERLSGFAVPVAVVRRRLRPDVIADARGGLDGPRHVVVDAWAGRTDAAPLLRDAAGWARVLAGSALCTVARVDTDSATVIALDGPGGLGASVTRAVGGGVGGVLTATALGARRVEVRVDSASSLAEVVIDDEGERRAPAPRRESAERLALRRVLAALAGEGPLADLTELRADDAVLESGGRPADH